MGDLLWLFWLGVGLACGWHFYRQRRRRQALAHAAAKCSLAYTPRDPLDLPKRYAILRLFQRGHDRRARDVLTGAVPAGRVHLFSYAYDVGFGSDRRHVDWAVGVLETDRNRPRFVRGENHGDASPKLPVSQRLSGAVSAGPEGRGDVSADMIQAVRAWASGENERYQVEIEGRFVAIYCLRDGSANEIDRGLEALTGLARQLEQAEQTHLPAP